jgi:hypothetical protein
MPTLRRLVDSNGPDFYPTPPWATYALIDNETFRGPIWECACADGKMSQVLETKYQVLSSDLHDRGYGQCIDFLTAKRQFPNIVTNPPYHSAEEFVHTGMQLATRKLALLMRLAFLEGINRAKTIFLPKPPSRVWVFSERITFYPANMKRAGSGTQAFAWFVWDRADKSGKTELRWFKPQYRHGAGLV